MSARSSLRELVLVGGALAACGKSGPPKPEANPAEVTKLTTQFANNVPAPAAVRDCEPRDYDGGMMMTFRSLQLLAFSKVPPRPEDEDWTNPPELDDKAVRALVEAKDPKAKATRQAAAEFLAASHYVVYRTDYVDAPMALGVKDLKMGSISTRVIRYEKNGQPACVIIDRVLQDQKIQDDAIAVSDKANIDPAVAKILREDITRQYLAKAPRPAPLAPKK